MNRHRVDAITPGGITAGTLAPIAVAQRSGFDESLFHGAGVVVDTDGRIVASLGDPTLPIYPRSALKPIQAHAMCIHGLELPDELLALACASHDGRDEHLRGVTAILGAAGLDADALANTPALPYGVAAQHAALAAGLGPRRITQNCSGKHAAMLATCVVNGWPTAGYLDVEHPLQQAITAAYSGLGCEVLHVGIDGCGAPTHVLRLDELAIAIGRLAATRIGVAMHAHPGMVGGPDRDVTVWMRAVPGLVAKEGADGVMVLARPGIGAAAFKIADGSDRARQAVTAHALRLLGVDVAGELAATAATVAVAVLGHGRPVGEIRALDWADVSRQD